MDQAEAVTAYLDSLPPTARQRVEQIRSAVHSVADGLGEKIAYGILTFTLDGRTVCHTGGYAAHVAVYPVPDASGDHALAERMEPYIAGKGTLKFPHGAELPLDLIEDVALAHLARVRGATRP